MFRTLVVLCLALFTAAILSPNEAQAKRGDRWVRIAAKNVDLRQTRETIDLSGARGSFKAFRLRVVNNRIRFSQVQFVYLNGTVHQIDKTFKLSRRQRTKPLDQRDDERFVDQVTIVYEAEKRGRKHSRLEVWGLQSRKGRKAKREVAPNIDTAGTEPASGSSTPPLPPRLSPSALASEGDVMFGAQYVGFSVDRDVISVSRKVGKFGKIRLRVRDNDIFIQDVKVIYATGAPQIISVNSEVLKDSQTDWLLLSGNRFVDEIQLSYRSRPDFEGQARVEVFGLHSDDWLGPDGEGRKFNGGWVLLGARPAGFIGFDKDVIPVGINEGGFREIRVSVRERAITLSQLKVIYSNGQEDIIPVRARVDAGSTYGPIGLRSEANKIAKIEARYRSRFIDRSAAGKGNAIVEVWARH